VRGGQLLSYNLKITNGFTDKNYWWIYFVSNIFCNNNTSFFLLLLFIIYSFLTIIPSIYTDWNFLSAYIDGHSEGNILLINIIIIYWWNIFICICQFSSVVYSLLFFFFYLHMVNHIPNGFSRMTEMKMSDTRMDSNLWQCQ
jgi:hypothetical protein